MLKIPFSKVDCTGNEVQYITEVVKSGWLTTASKTKEFEELFRQKIGVKHALAVNSCTAALHLALEAVGVGAGDKVIVPSLTFTATAEVVRYMGAEPCVVDVDLETGLLTAEIVKDFVAREGRVKACIAVHYAGQSAHLDGADGLIAVCSELGIEFIQDAAHAFPASDTYGMVGSIGRVTCFSFYANKTITTGEGGMLVTNDDELAARVKVMRLHGINRDVWDRFTSDTPSWEYDVVAPGFKYNMPDLNAAIGLAQLERADYFRSERERCARFYLDRLKGVSELRCFTPRVDLNQHAWHLFPIVLGSGLKHSRNEIIDALARDGIGTSVHYKPIHRLKYYKERYDLCEHDFPNSEAIWRGCLSLPLYPGLNNQELSYICDRLLQHARLGVK